MPSIFPEDTAGGVVIRDVSGNPTNPPDIERAYSPPPAFIANCLLTALPSDCNARIEPKQINAIVSELVAFAECMDPNGPWDCSSLKNLCAAFTTFKTTTSTWVYASDTPPPAPGPNRLWWESDTGKLFIFYNDGTSTQWVEVTAGVGTVVVDGVTIVGAGNSADPYHVGTIDCGIY